MIDPSQDATGLLLKQIHRSWNITGYVAPW